MHLILQSDQQARAAFADSEQWPADDGVDHGANPTPAMLRVFADLAKIVPADFTLTVCRDWEGCPIGIMSAPDAWRVWDDGIGDILAFTGNGRIGSGGVNMPRYFDSVAEYVAYGSR